MYYLLRLYNQRPHRLTFFIDETIAATEAGATRPTP